MKVNKDKVVEIVAKSIAYGMIAFFIYGIYYSLFGVKKTYIAEKEKAVLEMNEIDMSFSEDDYFKKLQKTYSGIYPEKCSVIKNADNKYEINISGDIRSYGKDGFGTSNLGEIVDEHSKDQFLRLIQMSWKRLKHVKYIRINYHDEDSYHQVADYSVEIMPNNILSYDSIGTSDALDENTENIIRGYILNNRHILVDSATGKIWNTTYKHP